MQCVPPHTHRQKDRERERMSSRSRGGRLAWERTDIFWSRKTRASPGLGAVKGGKTATELEEGRGMLPALPSGAPVCGETQPCPQKILRLMAEGREVSSMKLLPCAKGRLGAPSTSHRPVG